MQTFRTHDGRIVDGPELAKALKTVAQNWRDLAHAIRKEDCYASHVTEATKDKYRDDMLSHADEIEAGYVHSFTIWQRLDTVLTGECVALLS